MDLFADIRQRIRGEALPAIDVADLRAALRQMKPSSAMGIDRLCSLDVDRLPDIALAEMAGLFSLCVLHHVLGLVYRTRYVLCARINAFRRTTDMSMRACA